MSDIYNTTGLVWNGSSFVASTPTASSGSSTATASLPKGPNGEVWGVTPGFGGIIPGPSSVIGVGPVHYVPGIGYVSDATGQPVGGGSGDPNLGKMPAASVPQGGLALASAAGGTPVAQGFDMFYQMLQATLQAEQLRQSAIDQTVNIAQLASQLQRASPTQAADFATQLGLPGLEPNLGFANRFAGAKSTGSFGGKVGSQDIKLPFAFNGKEMSFFQNNPNVASIISDIGARFGRPDVLGTSRSSLIPAGSNLFSLT